MKLIIEDDEGHKTTVPFVRDEITVGREEGNTIRLTERNVSRRHARFYRQNGTVFVEDLDSFNGIKVNGDVIDGSVALKEGDLVQIGDFDLAVQPEQQAQNGSAGGPGAGFHYKPTEIMMEALRPGQVELDPSKPAQPVSRHEATSVIRAPQARPAAAPTPVPAPANAVEIAPEQAPRLVITSTELAGREFACIRSVLTVGRGDECDIVISHRSLSRVHCRIEREPSGAWKVIDLGASNRVQVNGEEYAESALHGGDVVTLGHVKLRFVAPGEDYTYAPEGQRGRSPVALFVGAALGAAVLGGATFYFLAHRKAAAPVAATPPEPPKPLLPAEPAKGATAPEGQTEETAAAKGEHAPPAGEVKVEPANEGEAKLAATLREVEAKLNAHDVHGAQKLLEESRNDGQGVKAYEAMVARTQQELEYQGAIQDARAPDALPSAAERLSEIPQSSPSYPEAVKLLAKLKKSGKVKAPEKAAPRVAAAEAPAPAPELSAAPQPLRASEDNAKRAREAYERGLTLMRSTGTGSQNPSELDPACKQFRTAVNLEMNNPTYHRMLGTCLAYAQHFDEAAKELRSFIKYAPPGDPNLPIVKERLEAYEKSQQ